VLALLRPAIRRVDYRGLVGVLRIPTLAISKLGTMRILQLLESGPQDISNFDCDLGLCFRHWGVCSWRNELLTLMAIDSSEAVLDPAHLIASREDRKLLLREMEVLILVMAVVEDSLA